MRRLRILNAPFHVLTFGLLLAGLVALPMDAQIGERSRQTCHRVSPRAVPHYTVSGTWVGDRLYLVDPSRNAVLIYDDGGHYLGTLPPATEAQLEKYFPSTVKSREGNLVLELSNRRLVHLDGLYRPVRQQTVAPKRQLALRSGARQVTESLESMFLYEFAGKDVVACSDIKTKTPEGQVEWTSAIVRFPLDNPTEFQTFTRTDFREPEWLFCRLGLPLIAAVGDVGFVVLMNDRPGLYRIEPGATEMKLLRKLPADLVERPSLPDYTSIEEYALVMDQVEQVSMPAGLYGWHGKLFMLYRSVGSKGATRWEIYRLDPATGAILGKAAIDSDARHLQIVPGDKRWLILEKDRVQFLGYQRTLGFLLLDPELFEGDRIPEVLCSSG